MVNHFRTLLMNVDGSLPRLEYAGEEIVDPAFRAVLLPASLRTIRAALFGTQPDRSFLNYRVAQLMAIVHATPLAEFVTALDPRITYDPFAAGLADDSLFEPVVTKIGSLGGLCTLTGTPAAPDATGRALHRLRLTTLSPTEAKVERLTPPTGSTTTAYDTSTKIALTGTGLSAKLSEASDGQMWEIELTARPQRDLADLVQAASNLGEPVYLDLFGLVPAEPQKTFRALWTLKQELPLRLAGLVCALVYATEGRRRG